MTSRRVNALDTVVIPRIANTVEYIKSELDEVRPPHISPYLPISPFEHDLRSRLAAHECLSFARPKTCTHSHIRAA